MCILAKFGFRFAQVRNYRNESFGIPWGGNSLEFLELPHKMDFALITAEEGERIDAHIAAGQVEFGQIQAGMYDVNVRQY